MCLYIYLNRFSWKELSCSFLKIYEFKEKGITNRTSIYVTLRDTIYMLCPRLHVTGVTGSFCQQDSGTVATFLGNRDLNAIARMNPEPVSWILR